MSEPLLRIDGLTCAFGGRPVVSGFSATIRTGELVALVGPNGSGKTTILNAISGFHADWAGRIEAMGVDLRAQPAWRRQGLGIGRTFQVDRAFWQMSVADAVFALLVPGPRAHLGPAVLDRTRGRERAWWMAADRVVAGGGVGPALARIEQLSSGQLRSLSLRATLATRPRLVLLDEPFSSLSPERSVALSEALRARTRSGEFGGLLVDHDLDLVRRTCDRAIVIDAGETVWSGRMTEPACTEVLAGVLLAPGSAGA